MWEVEDGGALWHETRGSGPFDTTMTVSSDNNGELLDPNRTVRTSVSQGVSRTLRSR